MLKIARPTIIPPKPPAIQRAALNAALGTIHLTTLIFKISNWVLKHFFNSAGRQRAVYRELYTLAEAGNPSSVATFLTQQAQYQNPAGYVCKELLPHQDLYPHLPEILRGANVCFKGDQGTFYDQWKALPGAKSRPSSHQCQGKEYALDYFLFWKDLQGNTRFQFEKSPLNGVSSTIDHFIDYLRYKRDNQQQGIAGISPLTEHYPLDVVFG